MKLCNEIRGDNFQASISRMTILIFFLKKEEEEQEWALDVRLRY